MQSTNFDLTYEGIIFRDLHVFARLNFTTVSYSCVPTGCIKLAHDLAAVGACGNSPRFLWLQNLPPDVSFVEANTFAVPE
jgi:hypothetical protein